MSHPAATVPAIFVCVYCGQNAPHEWGVSRRCPDFPEHLRSRPRYMWECEFEALELRLTCPGCLFASSESTIFGHDHSAGCAFSEDLS